MKDYPTFNKIMIRIKFIQCYHTVITSVFTDVTFVFLKICFFMFIYGYALEVVLPKYSITFEVLFNLIFVEYQSI